LKKLKEIRDVLGVIWGISIVVRIVAKVTDLYVMPKWSGYLIIGIIFTVVVLSLYIYFKQKKK
jgi:Mg2+ and Co2+ transporter CorA